MEEIGRGGEGGGWNGCYIMGMCGYCEEVCEVVKAGAVKVVSPITHGPHT